MKLFLARLLLFLLPTLFFSCSHKESFSSSKVYKSPHQAAILNNGWHSLQARLQLIRGAKKSICIQTFIWTADECGRLLFYELLQAAKRGVKVRVIADQMFSHQKVEDIAAACRAHKNLQIKFYNPNRDRLSSSQLALIAELATNFHKVNHRMHNKVFIVDGRTVITGGRNIENTYFDYSTGMNYKDRDVLIRGRVVRDVQESFDDYWAFPMAVSGTELLDIQESPQVQTVYSPKSLAIKSLLADVNRGMPSFKLKLTPVNNIAFYADSPGKNKTGGYNGSSKLNAKIISSLTKSQQKVLIQSPYLVLSSRAEDIFEELFERRVSVQVSTNSLAATDSWPAYGMLYKQKKLMISNLGFEIFEFKPLPGNILSFLPAYASLQKRGHSKVALKDRLKGQLTEGLPYLCLHAKSMVVDGKTAFIGSYNLDPRSANLNSEVCLIIEDQVFAAQLERNIAQDLEPQNSWVIAAKQSLLPVKYFNDIMTYVSSNVSRVTQVDLWPFRQTASFELLPGKKAVPASSDQFYENYQDVGPFPGLSISNNKIILARLFKAFGGITIPIL